MSQIRLCRSNLTPKEFLIASETTHKTYQVIRGTMFADTVCTCLGFTHRGYCKHARHIDATRCDWVDTRPYTEVISRKVYVCPICGDDVVDFDLESQEWVADEA